MKDLESFVGELHDIPAIVGTGLPELRRARYLLVEVAKGQAHVALAWLRHLLTLQLVHSLDEVRHGNAWRRWWRPRPGVQAAPALPRLREAVTLAFSHAGLMELGVVEDAAFPFPSAFRAGMASTLRRQLLGDAQQPAWQWGDVSEQGKPIVHILVAHYWREDVNPSPHLDPAALPAGLQAIQLSSCPSYIEAPAQAGAGPALYEPFGFRDGIGQPVLAGLSLSGFERRARTEAGKSFNDRVIYPGEFVLGQVNEYRERAYCPNVKGWPRPSSPDSGFGRNGSYLAVRQIEQDVPVFVAFAGAHPALNRGAALVGRRASGRSLLGVAQPPQEIDAFRYLETDANGFECPRGAHARRAHPRDALAQDVEDGIARSKFHRLMRRGRVYAAACPEGGAINVCSGHPNGRAGRIPCGRGLMFVALNADLERQFEFVQRSWIAGSRFGDMSGEQDPLLGSDANRAFTVQGCPVGMRIAPLPRFTTVRGGGYFFAPSLSALQELAAGRLSM